MMTGLFIVTVMLVLVGCRELGTVRG